MLVGGRGELLVHALVLGLVDTELVDDAGVELALVESGAGKLDDDDEDWLLVVETSVELGEAVAGPMLLGDAEDEKALLEVLEEDEGQDDSEVEVHQAGDELAISFAEEVWPNAIKYFTQAQEIGDISDPEFEDDDEMEGAEEDDDDGDGPIDIRSLVQDRGGKGGPKAKKKRNKGKKKGDKNDAKDVLEVLKRRNG